MVTLALLLLVAGWLSARGLARTLPPALWGTLLHGEGGAGAVGTVPYLIFTQVDLPRLVISLLVGVALGWAGLLFQQSLRNPLADPATLGVSSGAYLALTAASIFAPGLLVNGSAAITLAGGAAACALVMLVARKSRYATVNVILGGLIVSLFCGAAASALALFHEEYLSGLFVWHSGSLAQNGWDRVWYLLPRLAGLSVCAALLLRPLALLALDDARAAALGVNVARLRLGAIAVGVAFSALSVSAVGVIGFVGLMAPNLAGLLGARTLGQRMIAAPLLGGLLLWLTDQVVQSLPGLASGMPTGSASALVGAPVLLWLLLRHREDYAAPPDMRARDTVPSRHVPARMLVCCTLLLGAGLALGLGVGRDMHGWTWFSDSAATITNWRLPRVAAAGMAGAMLALAGSLLQRLTGNPLASPEVLGVSSGASLGILAALLLTRQLGMGEMLLASMAGAVLTLLAVVALNWRSGFAPQRLLLAGVALSTLLSACAAFLLTSGDPRAAMMLTWMSGSTYRATTDAIAPGMTLLVLGVVAALLGTRLLAILPLGTAAARALGVDVTLARLFFLFVMAALTAGATILVGPLSFVGLLGPHLVRRLGLLRPRAQIVGAVLAGASIMVLADWAGRVIVFPWQVPAGLVAMLVGGPAFLWFLWRSQ
ncbi:Fe3+-siderophore ABC transporter permease [Bordetella sp. N]|nr:Fe3+-siderophore ABC transporter permease [Bordetella sp. N]